MALEPSPAPRSRVNFGAGVSTGPTTPPPKFDVNAFIQSLMSGMQAPGRAIHSLAPAPAPVAPAPAANGGIPAPPPPAVMPGGGDRLQQQESRQRFQKSLLTPRHLGMSGEELTPQNPFTSGFFTPASQRAGLQGLAPQGDYGLIASHPYSSAFTETTPAEAKGIAGAYGTPTPTPPSITPPPLTPGSALATNVQPQDPNAQTLDFTPPTSFLTDSSLTGVGAPPPTSPLAFNPASAFGAESPRIPRQQVASNAINKRPALPSYF